MQVDELRLTASDEISTAKKTIYIVDDDESVCAALKILMVTYGFTVRTFCSAEEFFSAVPNSVQGCLILDIHLPMMDGWETIKRMIKSGSTRPVIIITADKTGGIRDQALKTGAVGFLQKPFNDHELVCFVNRAYQEARSI